MSSTKRKCRITIRVLRTIGIVESGKGDVEVEWQLFQSGVGVVWCGVVCLDVWGERKTW